MIRYVVAFSTSSHFIDITVDNTWPNFTFPTIGRETEQKSKHIRFIIFFDPLKIIINLRSRIFLVFKIMEMGATAFYQQFFGSIARIWLYKKTEVVVR